MGYYYIETEEWEVYKSGFVGDKNFDEEIDIKEFIKLLHIPAELEGCDFDRYVIQNITPTERCYVEGEDGLAIIRDLDTDTPLYILFQQRTYKHRSTVQNELNSKVYKALGNIIFDTRCTKAEMDKAIARFYDKFYEEV